MRYAFLALVVVACDSDPNAQARADVQRLMHHEQDVEPPTPPSPVLKARYEEQRTRKKPIPIATVVPVPVAPPPVDCEGTRTSRVAEAKDTILFWHQHVKEIWPLIQWAKAHKCELRDTTGSYLVRRTREAGGVRVEVKRGGPDEMICNTDKIKDGVDATLLREMDLLENTTDDDVMFETYAECDAKEKPSLRITFGDQASQKSILALP